MRYLSDYWDVTSGARGAPARPRRGAQGGAHDSQVMRDVKEKLPYISLNFDSETKATTKSSDKETTYELPDGNITTVGSASAARRYSSSRVLYGDWYSGLVGAQWR